MIRTGLISLLTAMAFTAVPALADTPANWSFNEQSVMVNDENPAIRMQAGLATCLGTPEGPDTAAEIVALFGFYEWRAGTWGELTELEHLTSIAYVADDNSFCEIGDFSVNTSAAVDVVRSTFEEAGVTDWTETWTGAGCTLFHGPRGRTIVVNSGGGDPVCQDDETSAIRVWNPEITQ